MTPNKIEYYDFLLSTNNDLSEHKTIEVLSKNKKIFFCSSRKTLFTLQTMLVWGYDNAALWILKKYKTYLRKPSFYYAIFKILLLRNRYSLFNELGKLQPVIPDLKVYLKESDNNSVMVRPLFYTMVKGYVEFSKILISQLEGDFLNHKIDKFGNYFCLAYHCNNLELASILLQKKNFDPTMHISSWRLTWIVKDCASNNRLDFFELMILNRKSFINCPELYNDLCKFAVFFNDNTPCISLVDIIRDGDYKSMALAALLIKYIPEGNGYAEQVYLSLIVRYELCQIESEAHKEFILSLHDLLLKKVPTTAFAKNHLGQSGLIIASERNYNDLAIQLVLHNAYLNHSDMFGNTSLHHACRNSNYSMMLLLVLCGADYNQHNKQGVTPIDILQSNEDVIGVQLIKDVISYKQNIDLGFIKKMSNYQELKSFTEDLLSKMILENLRSKSTTFRV